MKKDMLSRVASRARADLQMLLERSRLEGWSAERIEREKALFELGHEVTLCCKPGCTNLATPVSGFRDLLCPECSAGDSAGGRGTR